MSCRWSRTAAGIGSGTATAVARRRRAKERAVERRCIVLNDVLLGLLLVISDDDGDGELICCGCWFNCCFCDVGVEEERRRRNDQRRPNVPNFLCVVSQNYEI